MMQGDQLRNISERMKYRNFQSLDTPYKGWRPRPLTVALLRDLGGICIVKHARWWRHEIVHVPHATHLRCAQNRCYFLWHRLPGEITLRQLKARFSRRTKKRLAH